MTNYFEVDKAITCAGTAPIASTAVDIYAIKVGKDPLLVKKALGVSGGNWTTTITVPKTYVAPFGEVYLKVVDSYNPTIAGTKFYTIDPTLTIDAITDMEAGVQKAVTGTSNHVGQKVELESRLSGQDPEDSWTPEGNATVGELGTWSIDVTIANASTRDFRIIDENIDPDVCNAQLDDVVVASGQVEWMQFASTGGDTVLNTTKVEEDYVYLQGTTTATNLFGEATGVGGGGITRVLFVAKLNKNNFTKVWAKFYTSASVTLGENLLDDSTGNYLLFAVIASATNSVLRKIAKSDGATDSDITLDVASSTDTRVWGIMESASYYWMLGYSYVSSVYRTTFWRLAKDLTGLTTTRVQMKVTSTDYAQNGCISADGNYMIMFEPEGGNIALANLSTGTPTNAGKYVAGYVPYGKIVASNTKWLIQMRATNPNYDRIIQRSPLSDITIASATYGQNRGSTEATDRAGDSRYIGSKFYALFYDASATKFIVERIADNDAYSLEASVDIVPNAIDTAGNVGVNTHSFTNWDGTKGLLATTLEGKIHADADTSGNYDIVLKLFDLP
jgi:hypothetical protein